MIVGPSTNFSWQNCPMCWLCQGYITWWLSNGWSSQELSGMNLRECDTLHKCVLLCLLGLSVLFAFLLAAGTFLWVRSQVRFKSSGWQAATNSRLQLSATLPPVSQLPFCGRKGCKGTVNTVVLTMCSQVHGFSFLIGVAVMLVASLIRLLRMSWECMRLANRLGSKMVKTGPRPVQRSVRVLLCNCRI